ncbi:hypothetical protein D3C75_1094320 [compost metagenome]
MQIERKELGLRGLIEQTGLYAGIAIPVLDGTLKSGLFWPCEVLGDPEFMRVRVVPVFAVGDLQRAHKAYEAV